MGTVGWLNICPYNRVQSQGRSWGSKNRKVLQQNRIRVEKPFDWINVKDVCYREVRMSGLYLGHCGGKEL